MSVSRLPKGLSTAKTAKSTLWDYVAIDPTRRHEFFDDFDKFVAGDWTITKVGTGTVALADLDGGNLLITNTAADNDSIQLQKLGCGFLLAAGKPSWFSCRFKLSDATQSDLIIGLAVTDTTLMGAVAGAGATDGIFFSKDDGVATIDFQCQKDATTGQTRKASVATLVDDTFINLGWYYDGIASVYYFVNDVKSGKLSATSAFLPDVILTPSFGVMNGEAVAKTMNVDYVFAAKVR
jgi:hypothetical protein